MSKTKSKSKKKIGTPVGYYREKAFLNGIPHYPHEGIVIHGFWQEVLNATDPDGEGPEISVGFGAGLGSDHVTMKVGDESTTFYMRDVLKAWVATFDPALAARLPTVKAEVGAPE